MPLYFTFLLFQGNATLFNDALIFEAAVNDPDEDRSRLVMSSEGGRCAAFKNTPMRVGGWRIRISKEIAVSGKRFQGERSSPFRHPLNELMRDVYGI